MGLNKLFIGIDPGVTGALAILKDGQPFMWTNTPVIGSGRKKFDKQKMARWLEFDQDITPVVVLEDVGTIQIGGKASNFNLGNCKGLWEGMLMARKIKHILVPPKVWQKEVWQQKVYKVGGNKIDTKATSLLAAKSIWPDTDFHSISPKTGKKLSGINDGLVDALLMAEYARRKNL